MSARARDSSEHRPWPMRKGGPFGIRRCGKACFQLHYVMPAYTRCPWPEDVFQVDVAPGQWTRAGSRAMIQGLEEKTLTSMGAARFTKAKSGSRGVADAETWRRTSCRRAIGQPSSLDRAAQKRNPPRWDACPNWTGRAFSRARRREAESEPYQHSKAS